ncbi:MAG: AraC family transcriptional regulator [Betaproteobacteria bacterium]|nr:AraC family transcriptional regulator [Betaproteobacteria bacterium]
MGTALVIPALLKRLGVDPVEVLAEAGIDMKLFDDPEYTISLAAHNRIVQHCADRTRCAHFGLLVGQQDGLQSLGLVGLLVRYSTDIHTALNAFVRHLGVHVRGAHATLTVDGKTALLSWEIHEPGVGAHDQVGDGAIAVYCNILRELCGPDWKPTEVWFAHRRPADVNPFRQFFQVPLRFDAEQFALLFSTDALARRLPIADPQLHELLLHEIDAIEVRHHGNFPEQVRSVLRTALLTGHARSDQVAGIFGMHSRTMHRRLSEFGVGFQQLVDESRFEFAQQLMEDSSLDLARISAMLGYAAPGVFSRAFQRWSGMTPLEWRTARARGGRRTAPEKQAGDRKRGAA